MTYFFLCKRNYTVATVVLTCKRNSMVCQSNSSFIGNIIILQNFEISATYVYNHTIQGSTSSTSQSNYCVCMVYLVIKTYLLLVDIEFD